MQCNNVIQADCVKSDFFFSYSKSIFIRKNRVKIYTEFIRVRLYTYITQKPNVFPNTCSNTIKNILASFLIFIKIVLRVYHKTR